MIYPKISIVTPSFNQGKFLEETIRSVLNQNYPNLEYIVIDGGSTDNSVEVIKKYEKYLSYWVSEPDLGQTHAINKGFEKSTGDILAYLNSDDLYMSDTLHIVSKYFIENQHIKFLYGNVQIVDERGNLIKNKKQLPFEFNMGCMIGFGLIIDQQSTFWKREVFEKIGAFNDEFQYNMDGDYWFRVAQQFKMTHIRKTLAKLRWHSTSKSRKNKKTPSHRFLFEKDFQLKLCYSSLAISRIIPYKYSHVIRLLYRIKRVFLKLFS